MRYGISHPSLTPGVIEARAYQLEAADEALRRTGELAKQLRSEMKATQDTLARAKAELAKRQADTAAPSGENPSRAKGTSNMSPARGPSRSARPISTPGAPGLRTAAPTPRRCWRRS